MFELILKIVHGNCKLLQIVKFSFTRHYIWVHVLYCSIDISSFYSYTVALVCKGKLTYITECGLNVVFLFGKSICYPHQILCTFYVLWYAIIQNHFTVRVQISKRNDYNLVKSSQAEKQLYTLF